MIGRIPIKYHKGLIGALLGAAFFVGDFSFLMFLGFFEEKETTGIIFKKTVVHPLSERLPYLFIGIGLIIIAILCLIFALKLVLYQGQHKKYKAILKGIDSISVSKVSEITNTTERQTMNVIQNMIDSSLIDDVYVDYTRREIVNKNYIPNDIKKTVNTCKNCGRNNIVIIGVPKKCDYCQTPIVLSWN